MTVDDLEQQYEPPRFRRAVVQRLVLAFAALVTLFAPWLAWAQESAAPPSPDAAEALALVGLVVELLQHAKSGRVALAIVAGLILVSQLVLRFGKRIPGAVGAALASPWATWLVPQVLSVLGALATTLATGAPFSLDVVLGAILVGLAGGGYGAKAAQLERAAAAGEAAAAAPMTKAQALQALNKGPPAP